MSGKLKIVISDFHVADGQESGFLNPWENFHHDSKLAELGWKLPERFVTKAADGVTPWALAVIGENAYVTPDWYVSTDQVPTWLYQAVHLTGPVRRLSDDELGVQVDTLSAKFENRLLPKKPWTSDKMTPGRLDAMKKAIVGLEMAVEEVEGSFKLNQHKSEADYAAVAGALAAQTDVGAQRIAHLMREARPEAFLNKEAFASEAFAGETTTSKTDGLERSAP